MLKLQIIELRSKVGALIMNSKISLNNFDEISKTIKDKKDTISDTIFDLIKPFTIGTLTAKRNMVKQKGFSPGYLITLLMLLPFFNIYAFRSFFLSGYSHISEAQKDTIFRLKNNPKLNWRKFLYLFAKWFIVLSD